MQGKDVDPQDIEKLLGDIEALSEEENKLAEELKEQKRQKSDLDRSIPLLENKLSAARSKQLRIQPTLRQLERKLQEERARKKRS